MAEARRKRKLPFDEPTGEVLREFAEMDVVCTFLAFSATYAKGRWVERIKLGERLV